MSENMTTRRRRLGQALAQLLIAFVCLDPRLTAAYQATISEVRVEQASHQRPAAHDNRDSIVDRLRVAAGVVA